MVRQAVRLTAECSRRLYGDRVRPAGSFETIEIDGHLMETIGDRARVMIHWSWRRGAKEKSLLGFERGGPWDEIVVISASRDIKGEQPFAMWWDERAIWRVARDRAERLGEKSTGGDPAAQYWSDYVAVGAAERRLALQEALES